MKRCQSRGHLQGHLASRGFLLLEVTIAVAIFAGAVVGLSLALNRILDAQKLTREERDLRFELENRLALARVVTPEEGTVDLDPDTLGRRYQRVTAPLELVNKEEAPLVGLWKITINALPPKGEESLASATIYVYRQ